MESQIITTTMVLDALCKSGIEYSKSDFKMTLVLLCAPVKARPYPKLNYDGPVQRRACQGTHKET